MSTQSPVSNPNNPGKQPHPEAIFGTEIELTLNRDIEKSKNSNSTENSTDGAPTETEIRRIRGWKWVFVVIGLFATSFLYGLDTTITADVQAPVLRDLGEITKLGWLGIGFPMGSIAAILPLGVSYGKFDIKWLYVTSILTFEVGSAVCGAAPTMNVLIVGRVLGGIGGAGMYLG